MVASSAPLIRPRLVTGAELLRAGSVSATFFPLVSLCFPAMLLALSCVSCLPCVPSVCRACSSLSLFLLFPLCFSIVHWLSCGSLAFLLISFCFPLSNLFCSLYLFSLFLHLYAHSVDSIVSSVFAVERASVFLSVFRAPLHRVFLQCLYYLRCCPRCARVVCVRV
jgi:hypothetical protein